jgi:hypothetical protein
MTAHRTGPRATTNPGEALVRGKIDALEWAAPGTAPEGRRLPPLVRRALGVQGAVMVVVGVALLAVPVQAGRLWPWSLTALTGRAVGTWLVGLGIIAAQSWHADRRGGFGLETGQSLPKHSCAPDRSRLPNGYCQDERSGPRNGSVSSVICGSSQAHSGWQLASTPSSRNRGRSCGCTTWMCEMWCRPPPAPLAERAGMDEEAWGSEAGTWAIRVAGQRSPKLATCGRWSQLRCCAPGTRWLRIPGRGLGLPGRRAVRRRRSGCGRALPRRR